VLATAYFVTSKNLLIFTCDPCLPPDLRSFASHPRTIIGSTRLNPALKILNILSWRLPTFARGLSSARQGLTSLFGMGRGVTLATNHQDKMFKQYNQNFSAGHASSVRNG